MKIKKHNTNAKLKSVLNISFYSHNRCFTKDLEEAKKYGFDTKDVKRFSDRVKKLKKEILENGWDPMSIVIIGIIEGEIVIVDGQGRITALAELVEEGYIDPNVFTLQVQTIEYDSKEELEASILTLNTNKTNWNSKEVFRLNVISKGDEDSMKALDMVIDIVNEFGVSDGVARTILFGYDGVRCNKGTIFKSSNANPLYPLYLDFMRAIKSSVEKTGWGSAEIKRLLSYSAVEAYIQIISKCMKEDNIETYNAIKERACNTIPMLSKDSAKRLFMGQKRDSIRTSLIDLMCAKLYNSNPLRIALSNYRFNSGSAK